MLDCDWSSDVCSSDLKDETVLDLDIADAPKSKPKAPAASETDDLLVQPSDEKLIPEETLIEEETDSGLTTEPLKLADEITGADTVEGQAITAETEALAPPKSKRTGARRRATAAVSVAQETEIEKRRPNPIWTALMVASFVVAAYSCLFVYELTRVEGNKQARPSGLTAGMAEWTLKQFWGDAKWRAMQNKKFEGQKGPRPTGVSDKISYPKDDWYGKPSFMKPIQAPPPQVQTQ
jgi:hypothetical protein